MRNIICLCIVFLSLPCEGQTLKVVRVNNATVRSLIEEFTTANCVPHAIKFVQDGNGAWITSVENLQTLKYTEIRQDFKQFLISRGIVTTITSLKEALETYGVVIDYVSPPVIPLGN